MNQKRNKGITLIALVITIIVLLILAGVTINMVLGDEGIIHQAQQAKTAQENAEKEQNEELNKGEYAIAKHMSGTIAKELEVGDYVEYKYKDADGAEQSVICVVAYNDDEHGLEVIFADNAKVSQNLTISDGFETLEEAQETSERMPEILNEEVKKYLGDLSVSARPISRSDEGFLDANPTIVKWTSATLPEPSTMSSYNCYAVSLGRVASSAESMWWQVSPDSTVLFYTVPPADAADPYPNRNAVKCNLVPVIKLKPSLKGVEAATDDATFGTYYELVK